jgi:hypothetical protein
MRSPLWIGDRHLEVLGVLGLAPHGLRVEEQLAAAWPRAVACVLFGASVLDSYVGTARMQVAARADQRAVDLRDPLDRLLVLVARGRVPHAVAVRLARDIERAAHEHPADVVHRALTRRVQLLGGSVQKRDLELDVGDDRLAALVVDHVDHRARAAGRYVLSVDGPARIRIGPGLEVGFRLLVAVAEDPLGRAEAGVVEVVVLEVSNVGAEPVGVVDVRRLVHVFLHRRGVPKARLDRDDVAVAQR